MNVTNSKQSIRKGDRVILLSGKHYGESAVVTGVFDVNGFERYFIRLDTRPVEMYCTAQMLQSTTTRSVEQDKLFWYRIRKGAVLPHDFVALVDRNFIALAVEAEEKEIDRHGLEYLGHLTREAFAETECYLQAKYSKGEN